LYGTAPREPKSPQDNRGPEVVQAQGDPEDEKVLDHVGPGKLASPKKPERLEKRRSPSNPHQGRGLRPRRRGLGALVCRIRRSASVALQPVTISQVVGSTVCFDHERQDATVSRYE
jgi:hypothetical protein